VFDHGFHKLVILPTLSKHEGQDERWLARESAEEIVDHLETYRPFTKAHVVWAILAETGIRQSTLYALDLDDYDADERYLAVVNREETGTRLKNGYDAERELSISEEAARAIDGYIQENRNAVTDDNGREPLVTTRNGRLQKSTIRPVPSTPGPARVPPARTARLVRIQTRVTPHRRTTPPMTVRNPSRRIPSVEGTSPISGPTASPPRTSSRSGVTPTQTRLKGGTT